MFSEGRNIFSGGLSLEAIHQSSGRSFRDFFAKTTKESQQPFWNHSIRRMVFAHLFCSRLRLVECWLCPLQQSLLCVQSGVRFILDFRCNQSRALTGSAFDGPVRQAIQRSWFSSSSSSVFLSGPSICTGLRVVAPAPLMPTLLQPATSKVHSASQLCRQRSSEWDLVGKLLSEGDPALLPSHVGGVQWCLFWPLRYKHMEGACWGKEDASGSGARPLQWSQLSVPAVPVIALTTDITLTRRAHAGKGAWQLCLFTHQNRYACILQCPQARNTIRITGKFFRKTMTKLKLFNYQSHPVLHAWITRTLRKRLCFLSSLGCVMFRFSHTAIYSKLYFWCALANDTRVLAPPPISSTGRLKADGWGERGIVDL